MYTGWLQSVAHDARSHCFVLLLESFNSSYVQRQADAKRNNSTTDHNSCSA